MSRTTITTADEIYIVSADDTVPPEGRFRAFIAGQALDSTTKQPLPVALVLVVDEPGFTLEVKDDNWFVIAGILREQFPLLAAQSYIIHLTLSAPGYKPRPLIAEVPKTPTSKLPKLVQLNPTETEMVLKP